MTNFVDIIAFWSYLFLAFVGNAFTAFDPCRGINWCAPDFKLRTIFSSADVNCWQSEIFRWQCLP